MPNRKVPMGIGDWVEERKATGKPKQKRVGKIIRLASPAKIVGKDGIDKLVEQFVVEFRPGIEERIRSTLVTRHKTKHVLRDIQNHGELYHTVCFISLLISNMLTQYLLSHNVVSYF